MFSGVAGWLRGLWDFLGWFPRDARVCFLGLDNAGKTTLLGMLKHNRLQTSQPTLHAQSEELLIQNIRFRAFDLGGHETARRIWREYYCTVSGLVFLVDAADRTRFAEAREELGRLLEDPALREVPIAVLGNKIDIPTAASEDELRHMLGLYSHMTCDGDEKKGAAGCRPLRLFMCSIAKRMGYAEAFEWLGRMAV